MEVLKVKTAKLTIGIISIVLSIFIFLQSVIAGFGNALMRNGESSGAAGLFVALLMLIAGIIDITTRNSQRAGAIASGIIYSFAFLLGITNYGSYADLMIWSILCLCFSLYYFITVIIVEPGNKITKGIGIIILLILSFTFCINGISANKDRKLNDNSKNNAASADVTNVFTYGLEKTREATDVANLRAAKAEATASLILGEKEYEEGDVYWYNPKTGHMLELPVICGVGTDEKVSETNYSEGDFLRYNYDGSATTDKGIKILVVPYENEDSNIKLDAKVEFAAPEN